MKPLLVILLKMKTISKAEEKKIHKIRDIVRGLCRGSKKGMARTKTIFSKAIEEGITGQDTDRILKNLTDVGLVWTPEKGYKKIIN